MKIANTEKKVSESLHNSGSAKASDTQQVFEKREVRSIRYTLQLKKEAPSITPEVELYITNIIYGKKWQLGELDALPREEGDKYIAALNYGLNYLSHDSRDWFLRKLDAILQTETRHDLWEQNHLLILRAIDKLTRDYGRFPSKQELSKETGVSRVTITKHLKEYYKSEQFTQKQDEYLVMRENVLARLYKFASNGDTKAARIFLDSTNTLEQKPNIQNQQNNFVQINGTTITEEQIRLLPPDQQSKLLDIVRIINAQ